MVYEHDSYHCGQSGETPSALDALLNDRQKKVGYEGDQDLYLDGIGIFTIRNISAGSFASIV